MNHIKLPHFIIIAAGLALTFGLVFSRAWGTPVEDILAGIFVTFFYGLLIISYLLRFVLVFLGVFALYRVIRDRMNTSLAS